MQIGDLGISSLKLSELGIDPEKHKFFGGNHDFYNEYNNPYSLGDYGSVSFGGQDFYFVRGAFSIDKKYQQSRGFWFPEEELTYSQGLECIKDYTLAKPKIVLSHTCPHEIGKIISSGDILKSFGFNPDTFNTSTGNLLQTLFDIHKPDLWIHGHYHKNYKMFYKGTNFIGLGELNLYSF